MFEHHTALPLSVSLLIDTSGSTSKDLRYETTSLEKFLRALLREGNPDDAVALYAFNDEVTRLNSFTRREQRLIDSLKELRARAGTSLYDAVHLASRDLTGRDGRHVIVAVTDGGDTTSVKKYADAFESAQNVDAIIYPVLVIPITNDAGRNLGGERALDTLASGTGGRVFQPMGASELDEAFTRDPARPADAVSGRVLSPQFAGGRAALPPGAGGAFPQGFAGHDAHRLLWGCAAYRKSPSLTASFAVAWNQ